MKPLIKPPRLRPGDRVAIVCPSSGIAGDAENRARFDRALRRLENEFALRPVVMENALKGSRYLWEHPEKRGEDINAAFADPEIKGVIAVTGGDDGIRVLPYVDIDLIGANPKIFTGLSDVTSAHYFCLKAGLGSFYGASLFSDFDGEGPMLPYTKQWIVRELFESGPVGEIAPATGWIGRAARGLDNAQVLRRLQPHRGYRLLQGQGRAQGRLLGGCLEVVYSLRGTPLFPAAEEFEDVILFLETSPLCPRAWVIEDFMRSLGAAGILERLSGLLLGRPLDGKRSEEYDAAIVKVLGEYGRSDLPVLADMSFGHNAPRALIPFGALGQIDCDKRAFIIPEAVTEG
ncbi:Murein tetrapeptide carboxypeptidase [uncultured Clostridium sp.]|nr:Murein tetrapeptide carboxypeptidase [uncultured Clostridium sp.]